MMLELKNIYKNYTQGKMDVPVLKDISLSVDEGEYVAIMGPSGSGKTTLMNIIGCLDSPTSGEYILEGKDISQSSDNKLSDVRLHSIGFVFQSFYLLSRQSALENVALPLLYAGVRRKERLEIARKALERVGLGDRVNFKPTQLSGGQCQRVAIARAIVNNPKVLLADEPTGALDTKSGEQIMEIFQKLNEEGVTIVMITHEPEIAAHAKRVLHIRDGMLLEAQASGTTPAGAAPVTGETPAPSVPLPPDVIPVQEFHIAPKKRPAAPKAAQPAAGKKPAAAPAAPVREALPVERQPRKPAILVDCSIPLREDLRAVKPAPKTAPLPERRRATAPARGGAQARGPAKTSPRPPSLPSAPPRRQRPSSPARAALPRLSPPIWGAFFPRPKRGRSAEQKPLVPRTEF